MSSFYFKKAASSHEQYDNIPSASRGEAAFKFTNGRNMRIYSSCAASNVVVSYLLRITF